MNTEKQCVLVQQFQQPASVFQVQCEFRLKYWWQKAPSRSSINSFKGLGPQSKK